MVRRDREQRHHHSHDQTGLRRRPMSRTKRRLPPAPQPRDYIPHPSSIIDVLWMRRRRGTSCPRRASCRRGPSIANTTHEVTTKYVNYDSNVAATDVLDDDDDKAGRGAPTSRRPIPDHMLNVGRRVTPRACAGMPTVAVFGRRHRIIGELLKY
jgi:hypothetical protein